MDTETLLEGVSPEALGRLVALHHDAPHDVLGLHGDILRVWRPDAARVELSFDDGSPPLPLVQVHPAGIFAARVTDPLRARMARVVAVYADEAVWSARDPYGFLPTWGEIDQHLFGEGRHWHLHERLGARTIVHEGVAGVAFAVWAPGARRVSVVGPFNDWDGRIHAMRKLGATGVWELFVPDLDAGVAYQYEVIAADGGWGRKIDPVARQTEMRPSARAVVPAPSGHVWQDAAWLAARAERNVRRAPMSAYEVHLASWMRIPEEDDRWLTWAELGPRLAAHVKALGFTHIELMPVNEHPFDGSWGYQVTGYFAPTARFGDPDGFRAFVDTMHRAGIGVIVDWVPAHFPRDTFALARFDGTALYEHLDPRQGEHPDWGTLVFNYGRREVKNFLLASARMWVADYHVDGLRVDAVASMLYLDYSRATGEWIPNVYGGRENLEAIALLQELNTLLHGEFPGVMVIAEESTAWPGVTRPVYAGGLGFTLKWNMGWMHDTLAYFARDPVHRRWHHHELTFGLLYQYAEHFVLTLSHDEVVHQKRSLLEKMAGDRWQRFANLRALYGWMWCHPGRKLLFMGGEFGQEREWDHARSLDWHLLADPAHAGVMRLVGDLNALYRLESALHDADDDPEGFRWVEANDSDHSVLAFLRRDTAGRVLLCVLNATPEVRHGYRVGVPTPGVWQERLNTDAEAYGGSGVGNAGRASADDHGAHGHPYSLVLTLPPLGVVILGPAPTVDAE